MIYGRHLHLGDQNINVLYRLMRKLPFLFLPFSNGFRQPIHISQLSVFLQYCILHGFSHHPTSTIISLGGDTILSYYDLLKQIQLSLPSTDSARSCKIILIPDSLFVLLVLPFSLFSLKIFEALLRIFADLAYFHKVSDLSRVTPSNFPVFPLDLSF